MSHTPGKLVLSEDGRPELYNQCQIIESEKADLIVYYQFKNKADARRLVACWNALSAYSTEEIENSRFKPVANNSWGERSMSVLREAVGRGLGLADDGSLILQSGLPAKVGKVKKEGYRVIQIGVDGRRATINVARAVCFLAHGEPPTPDHVADHIDGNKLNDHPSNLRWSTRSENVRNLRKPNARAAIAKAEGTTP
jgi:hypothetical protein